jgi:non-heme chloroperoxidase
MLKYILLIVLFTVSALANDKIDLNVKSADGTEISAQIRGVANGREIVLIHGLAQSHLAWKKQYQSELASKFRILTYDLRGHGKSGKPLEEKMYAEGDRWADDLDAVIKAAGLKKPVLVGWSLGGAVIINYLRKYGDGNIAGVVFVDAVVGFDKKFFGPTNESLWQETLNSSLDKKVDGIINVLEACFAIKPPTQDFEMMLVYNALVPKEVIAAARKISVAESEKTIRHIKVPALFIQGEKDQLVTKEMAIYAQSLLPSLKVIFYADSGHSPFYEEPARFNSDLRKFIEETQ